MPSGSLLRHLRHLAEQDQRFQVLRVHLDHEVELGRRLLDAPQLDLHLGVRHVRRNRVAVDLLRRHVRRKRVVVLLQAVIGVAEVQPGVHRVLVFRGGLRQLRRGARRTLPSASSALPWRRSACFRRHRRSRREQRGSATVAEPARSQDARPDARTAQSETNTSTKITRMQVAVSWYLKSFIVLMSEKPRPPAPTRPRMVAARMLTSKR